MSDDALSLTSLRPYLLRAHHEWMSDNGLTPHLVVNAERPNVEVPEAFVKDGSIVLNISLRAVQHLIMDNEAISFSARFSGVPHQIYVPIGAVRGLVAREAGVGLTFPEDTDETDTNSAEETSPRIVETERGDGSDERPDDEPPTPTPSGKRPSLRVVK